MYRNRSFIVPVPRRLSLSLWFSVKCSINAPSCTKKGSALTALHFRKTVSAARVGLRRCTILRLRKSSTTFPLPSVAYPFTRFWIHFLLLCWLALLLVRIIEVKTGERWQSIRSEMSRMHVVDYRTPDGSFRQTTAPTAKHKQLLSSLSINTPPKLLNVTVYPSKS